MLFVNNGSHSREVFKVLVLYLYESNNESWNDDDEDDDCD